MKQLAILLGIAVGLAALLAWLVTAVHWGVAWWLSITAVAFLTYGYDKRIAGSGRTRVAENSLLLLALCGGTVGAAVSMYLFRHKTQKRAFQIQFLAVVVIQVALALLLFLWLQG